MRRCSWVAAPLADRWQTVGEPLAALHSLRDLEVHPRSYPTYATAHGGWHVRPNRTQNRQVTEVLCAFKPESNERKAGFGPGHIMASSNSSKNPLSRFYRRTYRFSYESSRALNYNDNSQPGKQRDGGNPFWYYRPPCARLPLHALLPGGGDCQYIKLLATATI